MRVFLFDGATGALLKRYEHPEPQDSALFGYTVGTMSTAIGDVAGSSLPDIYAPAVGQVGTEVGQGRGYVLNGDWLSPTPKVANVDDPTPHRGENFGTPASGIGDVSGDARTRSSSASRAPGRPATTARTRVRCSSVEPATNKTVLKFEDPDAQIGSGFGQGAVHLGDVNGDGLMDFATLAGYWPGAVGTASAGCTSTAASRRRPAASAAAAAARNDAPRHRRRRQRRRGRTAAGRSRRRWRSRGRRSHRARGRSTCSRRSRASHPGARRCSCRRPAAATASRRPSTTSAGASASASRSPRRRRSSGRGS